jgi:hypothetical protein
VICPQSRGGARLALNGVDRRGVVRRWLLTSANGIRRRDGSRFCPPLSKEIP